MISLHDPGLSDRTRSILKEYQEDIDSISQYEDRVLAAKDLFSRRNRESNPAFREVRRALDEMCAGNRRCCYCEDSCADEVEHINPKDLFPEMTFEWLNFLYACGSCNGPKRSKFAVINQNSDLVSITRGVNDPIVPPTKGIPAIINPRLENPLDFLELDIFDTFMFIPADDLPLVDHLRAGYTISVLSLNIREVLVQGRKIAYGSYKARLIEYAEKKEKNISQDKLDALQDGILSMGQPTVWEEMKRQYNLIPELSVLFQRVPEALNW